jgi:hypothetical protein
MHVCSAVGRPGVNSPPPVPWPWQSQSSRWMVGRRAQQAWLWWRLPCPVAIPAAAAASLLAPQGGERLPSSKPEKLATSESRARHTSHGPGSESASASVLGSSGPRGGAAGCWLLESRATSEEARSQKPKSEESVFGVARRDSPCQCLQAIPN